MDSESGIHVVLPQSICFSVFACFSSDKVWSQMGISIVPSLFIFWLLTRAYDNQFNYS
jgi:hypothetical protein